MDQAGALRRLRTRALDRLNALGQAIFHEMFGDRKGTRTAKLDEVLTVRSSMDDPRKPENQNLHHVGSAGFYPAGWENMTKEEKKECLRFNDQRGTAVTLLSEAGATIPQICSITGHTLQSATRILTKYMAMTEALSVAAIRLFKNAPETAFANRMQTTPMPAGGVTKIMKG